MRMLAILTLPTIFVMLASCGDDDLGGSFIPDPIEEFTGTPSFVQPGDKVWYTFKHIYRRTTAAGGETGLTQGEKQSAGSLCIDVTDVRDTETTRYKDAAETILVADVHVAGGYGQSEVYYDDMDNEPGDPSYIDGTLQPLWLKRAAFPTTGHGFESPSTVQFHSKEPPVGTNQSLNELPFFDARVSTNGQWGSWDFYNNDCALFNEEADCPANCKWEYNMCDSYGDNFFNRIITYFADALPGDIFDNPTVFKFNKISVPGCQDPCAEASTPTSCPNTCRWDVDSCVPDIAACQSKQCLWLAGECLNVYEFQADWRESLTASAFPQHVDWSDTPGAAVDVLHKLKLKYTGDGILYEAEEYIVPDVAPGSNLPSPVDFTACVGDEPCILSQIFLDDRPWGEAYCTF